MENENTTNTYTNRRNNTEQYKSNPHQLLFLVLEIDENGDPDRTIFVAKRPLDVKNFIYAGIKSKEFSYCRDAETKHPPIQAQHFLDDWEEYKTDRKQLNNYLSGCFLDTCIAGRRYTPPQRKATSKPTQPKKGLFARLRKRT